MIAKNLKANTIRNGLHSKREVGEGRGECALQFEFPIPDSHSDAGPRVVFVIDQHGIFLVKRSKASVYVWGRGGVRVCQGSGVRGWGVEKVQCVFARVSRKNICIVTFNVVRQRFTQKPKQVKGGRGAVPFDREGKRRGERLRGWACC